MKNLDDLTVEYQYLLGKVSTDLLRKRILDISESINIYQVRYLLYAINKELLLAARINIYQVRYLQDICVNYTPTEEYQYLLGKVST